MQYKIIEVNRKIILFLETVNSALPELKILLYASKINIRPNKQGIKARQMFNLQMNLASYIVKLCIKTYVKIHCSI